MLKRIPAEIDEDELFSGPREIVEIVKGVSNLDWNPNYWPKSDTLLAKAEQTIFRRQVWGLEFGFKPLRLIEHDGKLIWYMLYYVKNNGSHLSPSPEKDARGHVTYKSKPVNHTIRFFPTFVLESHELRLAYMDSVLAEGC